MDGVPRVGLMLWIFLGESEGGGETRSVEAAREAEKVGKRYIKIRNSI